MRIVYISTNFCHRIVGALFFFFFKFLTRRFILVKENFCIVDAIFDSSYVSSKIGGLGLAKNFF